MFLLICHHQPSFLSSISFLLLIILQSSLNNTSFTFLRVSVKDIVHTFVSYELFYLFTIKFKYSSSSCLFLSFILLFHHCLSCSATFITLSFLITHLLPLPPSFPLVVLWVLLPFFFFICPLLFCWLCHPGYLLVSYCFFIISQLLYTLLRPNSLLSAHLVSHPSNLGAMGRVCCDVSHAKRGSSDLQAHQSKVQCRKV